MCTLQDGSECSQGKAGSEESTKGASINAARVGEGRHLSVVGILNLTQVEKQLAESEAQVLHEQEQVQ